MAAKNYQRRRPLQTRTCEQDDIIALANLLDRIIKRTNLYHAHRLTERAFHVNGHTSIVREAVLNVRPTP